MSTSVHERGEGVKNRQNLVHVVIEWPLCIREYPRTKIKSLVPHCLKTCAKENERLRQNLTFFKSISLSSEESRIRQLFVYLVKAYLALYFR